MKLFYENQEGRSIIEMLGVLAIVGILSVGGIARYSQAMRKHKYMKLAEELNLFIVNVQPYLKDLLRSYGKGLSYSAVPSSLLHDLHVVPGSWKIGANQHIYDSTGQNMRLFFRANAHPYPFVIDYVFNDQNNKGRLLSIDEITRCQYIWQYVALPNAGLLRRATVTSSSKGGYFGMNYCTPEVKCLADMTLEDIQSECNSCVTDKNTCVLAIDILY